MVYSTFSALVSVLLAFPLLVASTQSYSNTTTIVSAFFPRNNDSYNHYRGASYFTHLAKWLRTDKAVVFYCPSSLEKDIRALRTNGAPLEIVTKYETVWDIPVIEQYKENFRDQQSKIDPERWYRLGGAHHPVAYAIWNSKPALLAEAAKENIFNTENFIWLDAGIARGANWDLGTQFPDDDKIKQVFEGHEDRVMISVIDYTTKGLRKYRDVNDPRPSRSDLIQGAIFGGKADSISWFNSTYYDLMRTHIERGDFVGREETNFNLVAMMHPDRFVALREGMGKWTMEEECGGKWFAFLLVFTPPSLRPAHCTVPDISAVPFESLIDLRWIHMNGWFPKASFWAGIAFALSVHSKAAASYIGTYIHHKRQLRRERKQRARRRLH